MISQRYAALVTRLRWPVLVAVAAGAYLATMLLPTLSVAGGGLGDVLAEDSPAVQAQLEAIERFGLPLLSPVSVVQHDPAGLDTGAVVEAVSKAAAVDLDSLLPGGRSASDVVAAIPVPNAVPVSGQPTTVVTYLFSTAPGGLGGQVRAAQGYAATLDPATDALVGVAGPAAVQVAQGNLVGAWLIWVEIGALGAVALIVGFTFRSVLAPVVTLVGAAVGYLIAIRVIGWVAGLLGLAAPSQLEPLVVALMLGIVTDYSILFLTGLRRALADGRQGRDAVRQGVARYLPTVLTAGLVVTAGVSTLAVAELGLFRAFGPGLAVTVLVGLAVSVTLIPALLAIGVRGMMWPSRPGPRSYPGTGSHVDRSVESGLRTRIAWSLTRRRVAASVAAGAVAVLLAAASPLLGFQAAVAPPNSLPTGHPVREAAQAASAGFAPGVLAPTEIIVEQPGLVDDRAALLALQRAIEGQPGVAAVVGPAQQPFPVQRTAGGALPVGLFVAPDEGAARYLVVFEHPALSAEGLDDLERLQDALPALVRQVGLGEAQVGYAGGTAVGLTLAQTAPSDLIRVGIVLAVVNLVLLMLFLRALVAPLFLLATSFLSVVAALGLTTWVFQGPVGYDGLIFYAPFAAAVLLISLGSDYNIFTVAPIWAEARHGTLREAIVRGLSPNSRPVNAAGLALAASFAFVGLIPVAPFRELAFATAVGVLIDTYLVRSLLVPSLIVLVGRASAWPSRRLRVG